MYGIFGMAHTSRSNASRTRPQSSVTVHRKAKLWAEKKSYIFVNYRIVKPDIEDITFVSMTDDVYDTSVTRSENNMGMYCYFIHFLFNNFII